MSRQTYRQCAIKYWVANASIDHDRFSVFACIDRSIGRSGLARLTYARHVLAARIYKIPTPSCYYCRNVATLGCGNNNTHTHSRSIHLPLGLAWLQLVLRLNRDLAKLLNLAPRSIRLEMLPLLLLLRCQRHLRLIKQIIECLNMRVQQQQQFLVAHTPCGPGNLTMKFRDCKTIVIHSTQSQAKYYL